MSTLTWINHSGFEILHEGTRLVADPWLRGRILNDAWDLLVPSVYEPANLETANFIWFSHEHPDHFSPPNLRATDPARRAGVTVLYQETSDKRVVNFCRSLGFQARELISDAWVELAPDFRVMVGKMPFYDSYVVMQFDGLTILNLNDCVIRYEHQLRDIQARIQCRKVDVVLQQFRSANWTGNPDQAQRMRQCADEKLDRFMLAVNFFRPKFAVPMASFSWFCNQDNRFQNLGIIPIAEIVARIRSRVDAEVVLLKPGDTWDMRTRRSLEESVDFYRAAEERLETVEYVQSNRVDFKELEELSEKFRERVRKNNNRLFLLLNELLMSRPLSGVNFYLEDLGAAVSFSITRGLRQLPSDSRIDITLASDCLAWLFRFDFGFDTLFASGRFKLGAKNPSRLFRTFAAPILNNMGKRLSAGLLFDKTIVWRAFEMLNFLRRAP